MGVVDRIMMHADRLTATERKIAAVLADEPQAIAFGTVAQVAQRAGTSGPSVVRLAVKLGYEGFVDLQADVQTELSSQLGPARDRIRQQPPNDLIGRVLTAEQDNVTQTLHGVRREALDRTVDRLSDPSRRIWIYPATELTPIGTALSNQLGQLRAGVNLLVGSEVTVSRHLAGMAPSDLLIAVDIHRYERSLVSIVRLAPERGAEVIALTDSPLSPIATNAVETFFISARGVGPFDSLIGGMALVNLFASAVAVRLRESAADRLDAIENVWIDSNALVADPGGTPSGSAPARPAGTRGSAPGPASERSTDREGPPAIVVGLPG